MVYNNLALHSFYKNCENKRGLQGEQEVSLAINSEISDKKILDRILFLRVNLARFCKKAKFMQQTTLFKAIYNMKNRHLLFLIPILILTSACKKDCLKYKDYEVEFYTNHEDFEINRATFETVIEQALVKPAHKEGAFFEAVTEIVLVKDASTRHQIADSQAIHIVVNAEANTIANTTCYDFFEEADFVEVEVPAEYRTRFAYRLLNEGTGPEVPAEYETISRQRLISDSEIVKVERDRAVNRMTFRIPENMNIRKYLEDQFSQQGILDCEEGNAYRILE